MYRHYSTQCCKIERPGSHLWDKRIGTASINLTASHSQYGSSEHGWSSRGISFALRPNLVSQAQVRVVRVALHVAAGVVEGQLPVCRQPQIRQLEAALRAQLAASKGAALYVAGLPGTGTPRSTTGP